MRVTGARRGVGGSSRYRLLRLLVLGLLAVAILLWTTGMQSVGTALPPSPAPQVPKPYERPHTDADLSPTEDPERLDVSLPAESSDSAAEQDATIDHQQQQQQRQRKLALFIDMPPPMRAAWRTSSERKRFAIRLRCEGGDVGSAGAGVDASISGSATFYGKSSLKLKYTRRRSLHIALDEPLHCLSAAAANGRGDGGENDGIFSGAASTDLTSFVLLSLWEDTHRIAYRTSAALLHQLGLFHPLHRLIELRCSEADNEVCKEDSTLGAYYLLEYPSDAIKRHVRTQLAVVRANALQQRPCESLPAFNARESFLRQTLRQHKERADISVEVGTRNWFYFEKPANYDVLHVPSYKRNSTISPFYRAVEQAPEKFAPVGGQLTSGGAKYFDLSGYMEWVAFNTLIQNGDYDDEVFFFQISDSFLGIMPWDYDSIMSACHRNGKNAIRTNLMFCAETPLERRILQVDAMKSDYVETLKCVSTFVRERWAAAATAAGNELLAIVGGAAERSAALRATFDDRKACCPDPRVGVRELTEAVFKRFAKLSEQLPGPPNSRAKDSHSNSNLDELGPGSDFLSRGSSCAPATISHLRSLANERLASVSQLEHKGAGVAHMQQLREDQNLGVQDATLTFPSGKQARGAAVGDVQLPDPGLYCVSLKASKPGDGGSSSACEVHVQRPIVVRSRERGKAEFAVPHFDKPGIAAFFEAEAPNAKLPKDAWVTVLTPSTWPSDAANGARRFPFVVSVTSSEGVWLRKNVMFISKNNNGEAHHVIRGFSAGWVEQGAVTASGVPRFPALRLQDGEGVSLTLVHEALGNSAVSCTVKPPLFTDESAPFQLPPTFTAGSHTFPHQSHEHSAGLCVLRVTGRVSIPEGAHVSVASGCTLLMGADAELAVHGSLLLGGTAAAPITVTALRSNSSDRPPDPWRTITVSGTGAVLRAKFVFFSGSGSRAVDKATGHHHKRSSAVTAVNRGHATLHSTFFVGLFGPGVAAGTHATVRVIDSVVQWAEMGAECVTCTFASQGTVWAGFPSLDTAYADEDNDGLYLSGGEHRVLHSVIAHTKDDGIDSGVPERVVGDGGSLLVDHTIVEMVAHEGIALSSSPKGARRVRIANTVVRLAQQGVESGYAGPLHVAAVESVSISNTKVGLRYGDNYRLDQSGRLDVTDATLFHNEVNALGFIRKSHAPPKMGLFNIIKSMFAPPLSPAAIGEGGVHPAAVCSALLPAGEQMRDAVDLSHDDAAALEQDLLGVYSF